MENKYTLNDALNGLLEAIEDIADDSEEYTEDTNAQENEHTTPVDWGCEAPSLKGKLGIVLNDVLDELILGNLSIENGQELLTTAQAVAIYEAI